MNATGRHLPRGAAALATTALALAGWGMALPARAHEAGGAAPGYVWTFDPWVVTPLAVSLLLYAAGFVRLRARAAGVAAASRRWGPALAYAAGWLLLAAALVSPLHWLGEHLFTFHMIEHEIVMAVAAPLLVWAQPAGVLLWGLPHRWRRPVGLAFLRPGFTAVWGWATRARHATLLHGAAIWGWHVPAWFDAAVGNVTLHRLQHLSFLATALLFWWAVLRRSSPGVAVWHLFVTMIHTSVLGALMALAPRVLYHVQTAGAPAFGLTPLEDQQLAGVIMWVPAETVYAGVALALAWAWIRRSGASAAPRAGQAAHGPAGARGVEAAR